MMREAVTAVGNCITDFGAIDIDLSAIIFRVAALAISGWLVASAPAPVAAQATTPEAACSNGIIISDPGNNLGLVGDCVTLLGIKETLAGTVSLNWRATTPMVLWEGVIVSCSRVTELALGALMGSIPTELGNLSHLQRLSLSGGLTGGIPSTLGNLSHLRSLYLGYNDLTGSIPTELGNLSQLQGLDLSHNELTGSIPAELGNLSNLYDLRLASNPLSGCIPNALTRVTHNDLAELRLLLCDATPTPTALPIATPTLSPDVSIFLPLVRR